MKSAVLTAAILGLTSVLGLAACSGRGTTSHSLVGVFRLTAGQCSSATAPPTGSYFVVGDAADGKDVTNPQSACANRGYTLLQPGTDGGLRTGGFQPDAAPVFDAKNNSRSALIITPVTFAGTRLGMATNAQDEQDAPGGPAAFPVPSATVTGTKLVLDLRALTVTYGGEPGGTCESLSGAGCWELGSRSVAGTYDPATHRFSVDWFVGESFVASGDSLAVHLEGTFSPS